MQKSSKIIHESLSRQIIGAGMAVLNELRPGLDEKLYENALCIELKSLGLEINQQKQFPVKYKGTKIGALVPDLIVEGKVIVDTKVVTEFNEAHFSQMIGYLSITGFDLGLLLNFKLHKLSWKRLVRQTHHSSVLSVSSAVNTDAVRSSAGKLRGRRFV